MPQYYSPSGQANGWAFDRPFYREHRPFRVLMESNNCIDVLYESESVIASNEYACRHNFAITCRQVQTSRDEAPFRWNLLLWHREDESHRPRCCTG